MLAEPPDGAHGADAHHRHLVGLEAAYRGLHEGRRRGVGELVGELAPDPQAAAEEERGRCKGKARCPEGRFLVDMSVGRSGSF